MNPNTRFSQRGATLIEIMAYLVIAGFILFGVMRTIGSGNADAKQAQAEKDINFIFASALKKKGFSTTFTGVTCDNLIADGWLQVGWTNCTAVNPYNGNYTAAPASNPTQLTVTAQVLNDPPACRRLAETFNKIQTASCSSTTLSVTFTL